MSLEHISATDPKVTYALKVDMSRDEKEDLTRVGSYETPFSCSVEEPC